MEGPTSTFSPRKTPELLAPAGSPAAFLAGLRAGADAFYLGVGRFNARARAQNFQLEDLEGVVREARKAGRKVYLALNILVYDAEVRACTKILECAEDMGVDGVILQDLGLVYLTRKYFPGLRVHASTQMFLHNSLHIGAMAERGVRRVTLPRELTLEEIRRIRARTAVELEVFVHGALCFSFSGLCLASAHLYGASGNRGVCKQVCRFAFEGGPCAFPFAMRDLEGRTCLEDLLQTGIDSLKIEGRLRNTDYIQEAVGYYRACLDAHAAGKPLPPPVRWRYSRPTTPGYFRALPYAKRVCTEGEPRIGEPVGQARPGARGDVAVTFQRPVSRGDRLRVLREDGVRVHEFTLLDRSRVRFQVPAWLASEAHGSWTVYRVGTSRTPRFRSLEARQGRLKTCPLSLSIRTVSGSLQVDSVLGDGQTGSDSFPMPLPSGHSPMDAERVRDCFTKVDTTPFRVKEISVALTEPAAFPVRELNRIRREFYQRLERRHDEERNRRNRSRLTAILLEQEAIAESGTRPGPNARMETVSPEDLPEATAPPEPGARLWVELPLFVSETRLDEVLRQWSPRLRDARLGFVAHSLGWVDLLRRQVGEDRVASGGYLYCANRFAYRFLREQGVGRVVLAPDLPKRERLDLLHLRDTVADEASGRHLFITRQPVPQETFRLGNLTLRVVPCGEYWQVVLTSPGAG